jgi:hypothetical protein
MMNKKIIIWIGSGLVVAGLGYLGYDWWKKQQDSKNEDAENDATTAPTSTPSAKPLPTKTPVASSIFPLQKGSRNSKVQELQLALGIPSSTVGFGYFGNKTYEALMKAYGKGSIDNESEFKVALAKIKGGVTGSNEADAIYIARRLKNISVNVLKTYGADFLRAWSNALKNGQFTFVHNGKKLNTQTGAPIKSEAYEYLINNGFTDSNIYNFGLDFVTAWYENAKIGKKTFPFNKQFYKTKSGRAISNLSDYQYLVNSGFADLSVYDKKGDAFVKNWAYQAKRGSVNFTFEGKKYSTNKGTEIK